MVKNQDDQYSIMFSSSNEEMVPSSKLKAYVQREIKSEFKDLKKAMIEHIKHVESIVDQNKKLMRIAEKALGKIK